MTTQTTHPPEAENRGKSCEHSGVQPWLMYVSNVQPDIRVIRAGTTSGAETPAKIDFRLGGMAGNGASVALANGITCGVAGVQAAGFPADWTRQLASARGLVPFLTDRRVDDAAITVATENGRRGSYDVFVQRMNALAVYEITSAARAAIIAAQAVLVGPMPIATTTCALLRFAAQLSQYAALIPHPTLTCRTNIFAKIARLFDFVQLNFGEAQLLDSAAGDLPRLACRVRFLLGDRVEFAITNNSQRGLLWAEGHWFEIVPLPVSAVNGSDPGDVFASAYIIARRFFRVDPQRALDYAVRVAAAAVVGATFPRFV